VTANTADTRERTFTDWVFVKLDFTDFDFSWSPVLISLFRCVVTGVRRIGMRPSVWRVGFPHCPVIAHITVSSVRLCPSLKKADCFGAVRTVLPSCPVLHTVDVLHVLERYFCSFRDKRQDQAFCAFSLNFVGLLLSFPEFYEIIGVFTLESDSDVREDCRSKLKTNIEPFFLIHMMEKSNCAIVGYSGLLLNWILYIPCIVLLWSYTGCPRRNVPEFGRVFLMLKYTDITQNTYIQSWTVTEIMAREVWNFESCYTLIDYQIHIKTGTDVYCLITRRKYISSLERAWAELL